MFSFDPDLGDVISRTRALLLDTAEEAPLFSDEAISNYHALFGADKGTANLATILLNRYGNRPTQATAQGLGGATWGDRHNAWMAVIQNALTLGVEGDATLAGATEIQIEVSYDGDPYRPTCGDWTWPAAVPMPGAWWS